MDENMKVNARMCAEHRRENFSVKIESIDWEDEFLPDRIGASFLITRNGYQFQGVELTPKEAELFIDELELFLEEVKIHNKNS